MNLLPRAGRAVARAAEGIRIGRRTACGRWTRRQPLRWALPRRNRDHLSVVGGRGKARVPKSASAECEPLASLSTRECCRPNASQERRPPSAQPGEESVPAWRELRVWPRQRRPVRACGQDVRRPRFCRRAARCGPTRLMARRQRCHNGFRVTTPSPSQRSNHRTARRLQTPGSARTRAPIVR